MIYPKFIEPGAMVGLVAPAGKIALRYVEQAERYLDGLGMRHIRGKYVSGAWHQFGGTDQQRAEDLNAMLVNPDVDVIWCMRGGYGAVRLLSLVNFRVLLDTPKWLVGFSDITVFHSLLQQELGLGSMHGPMPINFEDGLSSDTGMDQLWDFLQGEWPEYPVSPHPLNRIGHGTGRLSGGNLTILNMLKGADIDFDPKGKILFIEEVGEHLYHLDRMMYGLKVAGKLEGLAGLMVGQMTDMQDSKTPFGSTEYQIVAHAVMEYDYPVIFGFPAGHDKSNWPLLMGHKVRLNVMKDRVEFGYVKK
jgi:muramoyltetrapeptide carboxypeptidase